MSLQLQANAARSLLLPLFYCDEDDDDDSDECATVLYLVTREQEREEREKKEQHINFSFLPLLSWTANVLNE